MAGMCLALQNQAHAKQIDQLGNRFVRAVEGHPKNLGILKRALPFLSVVARAKGRERLVLA